MPKKTGQKKGTTFPVLYIGPILFSNKLKVFMFQQLSLNATIQMLHDQLCFPIGCTKVNTEMSNKCFFTNYACYCNSTDFKRLKVPYKVGRLKKPRTSIVGSRGVAQLGGLVSVL